MVAGIGVHEDEPQPFFAQCLERLRAGIIELAGLADNDRAGANQQYGFEIFAQRHGVTSVIFSLAIRSSGVARDQVRVTVDCG